MFSYSSGSEEIWWWWWWWWWWWLTYRCVNDSVFLWCCYVIWPCDTDLWPITLKFYSTSDIMRLNYVQNRSSIQTHIENNLFISTRPYSWLLELRFSRIHKLRKNAQFRTKRLSIFHSIKVFFLFWVRSEESVFFRVSLFRREREATLGDARQDTFSVECPVIFLFKQRMTFLRLLLFVEWQITFRSKCCRVSFPECRVCLSSNHWDQFPRSKISVLP